MNDIQPTVSRPEPSPPVSGEGFVRSSGATAWSWGAPILLTVLTFLVFVPALDAGFVGWDDDDLIFNTTNYRTFDAQSMRWMFTTSYTGHFQPLTWMSYGLDWAIWHRESFGYHLTNVILHVLTAFAFYALVGRLLSRSSSPSAGIRSPEVVLASLFAAVLFAIHPLRAESVAWIAERRDVLSGCLYVFSVYCYVRFVGEMELANVRFRRQRFFYLLALLSCAMSLLSKASAMTLPIVLLILDVYPLRRRSTQGVRRRRLLLEKTPFLILATLAGMRALIAQEEGGALYGLAAHDVWERLAQACFGLVFYLQKTVAPFGLGPLYEIPPRDILLGPVLWICVGILAGLVALSWFCRRKCPALWSSLLVFGVVVSPVLGFAQSGPQLVADRYSYLSCLSLVVLAGAGLLKVLQGLTRANRSNIKPLVALVCVALVAVLANATRLQADYWRSGRTLWARGVEISPNSSIAHTNYGDALQVDGEVQASFFHYRKALALNPQDAVAYHHMGDLAQRIGDENTAVYCYHKSLQIDPNRTRACFSLARILIHRGHAKDAVTILRDGAQRNPHALALIDFLADRLATDPDEEVRNPEEAIAWAMHVNQAQSFSHPPALMTLANAYAAAHRLDDAIGATQRALDLGRKKSSIALVEELERRLAQYKNLTAGPLRP